MSPRIHPHPLTREEARRAIYVDFEGCEGESPSILGVLIEGQLQQHILDERLYGAAASSGLPCTDLVSLAHQLLTEMEKGDRFIVAYTRHEITMFSQHAAIDLGAGYRDAHKIAKSWIRNCHPDAPPASWGLKDLLAYVGYPRWRGLGQQKTAGRIRYVREMLAKKGHFDALTAVAKAKWTKVLRHNEIDCRGMEFLTRRAVDELLAIGPMVQKTTDQRGE